MTFLEGLLIDTQMLERDVRMIPSIHAPFDTQEQNPVDHLEPTTPELGGLNLVFTRFEQINDSVLKQQGLPFITRCPVRLDSLHLTA